MENSLIGKVREFLLIAYPAAILLGYIDMHLYYGHFGIEIYQYLGIEDVLLLFMHNAGILLIAILTLLLVMYKSSIIIIMLGTRPADKNNSSKIRDEGVSKGDSTDTSANRRWAWGIFIAACLFILLFIFFTNGSSRYFTRPVYYHLLLFPYILFVITIILTPVLETKKSKLISVALMSVFFSFWFMEMRATDKFEQLKYGRILLSPSNIVIGGVEVTESDTLLVGKTSNYYFFYLPKLNELVIESVETVDQKS